MSFAQRVFGFGRDSDTADETPSASQSADEAVDTAMPDSVSQFFSSESPPQAYSFKREAKFSLPETVTIETTTDSSHATITVDTPKSTESFEVRIEGYTSRFGELDVEFISVGGYAVNLYHPKENGQYFVRRLYYYDGEGVSSEQHREDTSEPMNYDWNRKKHLGESVTASQDAHLRVYDWRQNMATHNKPHPYDGEVVLRFQDSLNSGGGNKRIDQVLTVNDIQSPVSSAVDVQFICLDVECGEYVLYAPQRLTGWCVLRVPIGESVDSSSVSWEHTERQQHPSEKDRLVWVRDPEHTWFVNPAVSHEY